MSTPAPQDNSTGIGFKFVIISAVASVAIALALSAVATQRMRAGLVDGMLSEGRAIAIGFATAAERVPADGATSLQPLIDSFRDAGGVEYLYVADSANNVIVHTFQGAFPQELLAVNSLATGGLTAGERVKTQELAELVLDGRAVSVSDVAAPLAGGVRGVLHVGMKHESIDDQVSRLWLTLGILSLLIVVAGVAAVTLLANSIVGPLRELTKVAAHIVESGDLTGTVEVTGGGEVGLLSRSFAQMVERLRSVIENLQQASEALNASTEQLNASASEQSQTVARQASALQETQVTAQEIRQTSLLASQKADAVLSVAERADELSRTGEAALEQTLVGLNDIRTQVQEIAAKILELGERTVQIGEHHPDGEGPGGPVQHARAQRRHRGGALG